MTPKVMYEISKAIKAFGVKVESKDIEYFPDRGRVRVSIDNVYFGIYDIARATFID